MKFTKTYTSVLLALSAITTSLGVNAAAANIGDTSVKFSGYIKADALYSDYSDGTLGAGNLGRDFYIPSLTPVGGTAEGAQFDSHVRQSRFRFTSATPTEEGDTITGVLEFDMLVTPAGNERVSNSYTPRLRHAFVKYRNWMVGQTWTTFMDVGALPESVDFIGSTDGTIFGRQAQVRYTSGNLELALENSETTVTPFEGGGRIVTDDGIVPDVVAKYSFKGDWGHVSVAGLVRQLNYEDGAGIDTTESSFGVSVTGKFKVGDTDDIRFSVNSGTGLGRYSALNAANAAVLDAQGELQAIDSTAFAVAYRHVWDKNLRSSLIYSSFSADNDAALTGGSVTSDTQSMRVNLMYSPTAKITVGGEYAFAKREIESGADGDMNRLQFMLKYAF